MRLRIEPDVDPMQQRFVIEVASVGRIAVVVKALGLRDHIVPRGGEGSATLLSLPVSPTAPLPQTLEPTEYLEAEVTMDAVVTRWDANTRLSLVAWAVSGDGRRFESRPRRVQTPPRPRVAQS